jgi:hypothetical protein
MLGLTVWILSSFGDKWKEMLTGLIAACCVRGCAVRRLLTLVAVLLSPAWSAGGQDLVLPPNLPGFVPSNFSVSVHGDARERELCGLPEDVASVVYSAFLEGAAQRGLILPPLHETEKVSETWQIASGGSSNVGLDSPLPIVFLDLTFYWSGDGRCYNHHSLVLAVSMSGTMLTAKGPQPLPPWASILSTAGAGWFANAGFGSQDRFSQVIFRQSYSRMGAWLGDKLRP